MSEQERVLDEYTVDGVLTYEKWGEALRDGLLLGQRCPECGYAAGSPRAGCQECSNRDMDVVRLPESGVVYSVTMIGVAPIGYDAGYQVAVVELGDARLMTRIEGAEVEIGDEVEFTGAEGDEESYPVFESS